jgi:hypothetical protein
MVSIRHWNVKTYEDAAQVLGNRKQRQLGYATWLWRNGPDTIAVIHHATKIIEYDRDGTFVVNPHGYHTFTTKERVNLFTPLYVWQKDWRWYVGRQWGDKAIQFVDGMRFTASGELVA